jgi:hypothetical protein
LRENCLLSSKAIFKSPCLKKQKKESTSQWKAYKVIPHNTFYFLPRTTQTGKEYFFAPAIFKPENDHKYKAFNRYFGARA